MDTLWNLCANKKSGAMEAKVKRLRQLLVDVCVAQEIYVVESPATKDAVAAKDVPGKHVLEPTEKLTGVRNTRARSYLFVVMKMIFGKRS